MLHKMKRGTKEMQIDTKSPWFKGTELRTTGEAPGVAIMVAEGEQEQSAAVSPEMDRVLFNAALEVGHEFWYTPSCDCFECLNAQRNNEGRKYIVLHVFL